MKVIVAGSRSIINVSNIFNILSSSPLDITEVVSGTARGVDRLGEAWALDAKIPIKRFPSNWDKHGRSAGYIRNSEMAKYADALIAIWDGESKGTQHMIDLAEKEGLVVQVYTYPMNEVNGS